MAKDIIHSAVKNALIKDGWTITDDPYRIEYEEYALLIDLAAERLVAAERNGKKIVVEIKSFVGRSMVRQFQQELGQYEMYLDFIELTAPEYKLYLAINEVVYNDFFTQKATQIVVKRHQMNLLVVDIEKEKIVKWIS